MDQSSRGLFHNGRCRRYYRREPTRLLFASVMMLRVAISENDFNNLMFLFCMVQGTLNHLHRSIITTA